jgi:hypothetical protein
MSILRMGSMGPAVRQLQQALNGVSTPSPGLKVDGAFGSNTRAAVFDFQDENWLVEDGVAGPCTQNALYGAEAYDPILWDPNFLAQPTNTTCWAASTAMLTGTSVPVVRGRTPADLIASDGGLKNFSDTDDAFTGARRYAQANGLRLVGAAMSPNLAFVRAVLNHGPLMLDMLWESGKYVAGTGSPGHMILVVGIRGDDDPSGVGTTLRIFDPWPPTQGDQYSVNFFKWMNEVSTRTYHMYQR